jgi:hypothetical protein
LDACIVNRASPDVGIVAAVTPAAAATQEEELPDALSLDSAPMAERKPFLLRIDPGLYDALSRWAADELRSLNGQIEYLLRQSVVQAGRAPGETGRGARERRKGKEDERSGS